VLYGNNLLCWLLTRLQTKFIGVFGAKVKKHINYEKIEKEGILNPKEVMELKEKFLNSNSYYDEQNIWNILIFELWYEHWFSG
jgi:hypothetical protein